MALFPDLIGTSLNYFRIGLSGIRLKLSGGNLVVRNSGDTADAEITASKVNASGDRITLNSDSASTGSDWAYNIDRPSSGMTAAVTFKLPANMGTAGQVLGTDGTNTIWISAASTAACVSCDTTTLAFNSGASVAMFTLPANAVVHKVQAIIDTAFDGTPTASVGYSGQTSIYMGASSLDLKGAAGDIYEVNPAVAASGSSQSLIITYSAGSATAGSARFLVYYSVPA